MLVEALRKLLRSAIIAYLAFSLAAALAACSSTTQPKLPDSVDPIDARIRFWESRLPRDPEDTTAAEQLGAAYLRKARTTGDFSYYIKAERLLLPVYECAPENYSLLSLLASAKAAQHKFSEALQLSEKAAALRSDKSEAYALIFDARMELGDLIGAQRALDELARREQGFSALTRKANLLLVKGNQGAALSNLDLALHYALTHNLPAEDIAWVRIRIGALNFDTGKYQEANKHYQQALLIAPESYLVLEHIAELLAAKGRYAESLALYDRVIAKSPSPEFFEAAADVYRQMGRGDESAKWLKQAEVAGLKHLDAGDIGYYRFLANFYSDQKLNPELALKFAKADLVVRQDAHTHETYAWALYRSGDIKSAAGAMENALASGLNEASVHCRAAAIFAANENDLRAAEHIRKARELNPARFADGCS